MNEPSSPTRHLVLSGRYALEARLGTGGAGIVWRAHDQVLDRTVAVKLVQIDGDIEAATATRFRAEATAAAKLAHPHAVTIYDIARDAGRDYLVMELVDGGTLEDVLARGPLPPGIVAALGDQIGQALGAAHARGFVHRDVKPANILLTREGNAKVADFGIARALGEATSRLTSPGHVMGTARYLAPEQLRDEPIDARADVYSLGLLLHQALTGQPPFGEGTAIEVAMRRLSDELPSVLSYRPDVPDALARAIVTATRPDPSERFPDGRTFAGTLAPLAAPDASRFLAARVPAPSPAGDPAGDASGRSPTVPSPTQPTAPYPGEPTAAMPPANGPANDAEPTSAIVDDDAPGLDATAALAPGVGASARLAPAATPVHPEQPPRRPPRRWIVWLLVAAVSSLVVWAALVTDGDDGGDPSDQEQQAEPTQDTTGDEARVDVVKGGDHDPFAGDRAEHPEDVPNAFDGDSSTTWQTQLYRNDPQLGGLKEGVGIWFDLGGTHEVTRVEVALTQPGASFTLYAGDGPPDPSEAPDEWGTAVAEAQDADADARVAFDQPVEGRVWMVWLTSLPADGGQYRASISDVRFFS